MSKIINLITLVAGIGGLLSYLIFIPRISLQPSSSLDPRNPFSAPFILENRGQFSIYEIKTKTKLLNVVDSRNNSIVNSFLVSSVNDSSRLTPDTQTALNISIDNFIAGLGIPYKEAVIEIIVEYKPFLLHWKWQKVFRYRMINSPANGSVWLPTSN